MISIKNVTKEPDIFKFKTYTMKKYIIRSIIIIILFLLSMILNSCNRYFEPERYANPRHKYTIRTTKGERKMNRIIRKSIMHNNSSGCGYQK
ncbi:MAG: hypothetical protein RLZZ196_3342 [Bacteroidota bacterium]|jgi:regulatory protein YycH of two-component signal transduction system YycFG